MEVKDKMTPRSLRESFGGIIVPSGAAYFVVDLISSLWPYLITSYPYLDFKIRSYFDFPSGIVFNSYCDSEEAMLG